MRILLVDDEPLARRGLQLRLSAFPDAEIVGEAANGREALAAIGLLKPDLLFLDVQMPGIDVFAALRQLNVSQTPLIVFVTAHDRYAVAAFAANATDYLLKPIDNARLAESMHRARVRLTARAEPVDSSGSADTLTIKDGQRLVRINLNCINWIDAADDYVCIHAGSETHILRGTMHELEQRLDPCRFARVHRSAIVNIASVKSMRPHLNGEYFLLLESGHEIKLSRSYKDKLRLLL